MPLAMAFLRAAMVGVVLSFVQLVLCGNDSLASGKALALEPSQYWDGNDGPWSTFGVQVGTPSQQLRLLPATNINMPWVVIPEGCIEGDPANCGGLRGTLFKRNESKTWEYKGGDQNSSIYALMIYEERMLEYSNDGPYNGNALYGWDTMTLGWPGNALPTIVNQTIAGIATKDFYLGTLGIFPDPINFTDLNNPSPSMLQQLKTASNITSLSWGYTAGAYNYVPKTYGSLTLGGYDASRFEANNLTIPFGADSSRDLLPFIQSISATTSGNPTLLSTGIYAFIDSLVPYIWLPKRACSAFEKAFGLQWNDTLKLYPVDNYLHNTLLQSNPSVTFTIGANASGDSVDIVMPYWAFDLVAGSDLLDGAGETQRYFPLKQADNDTQYTLGRAFLQSAYVIADYERRNFSVSQAKYPSTSVARELVPILPPGLEKTSPPSSSPGLSTGGIVGVVIGSIVVIALVGAAVWLLYRRRRKPAAPQTKEEEPFNPFEKQELDATQEAQHGPHRLKSHHEVEGSDTALHEADGTGFRTLAEADGAEEAKKVGVYEMFAHDAHESGPIYEMPANEEPALPEMEGSQPVTPESSREVSRNASRNASRNVSRRGPSRLFRSRS